MSTNSRLCLATLALTAAEVAFWLYATDYIDNHARQLGAAVDIVTMAIVPITTVLVVLVLPALILGVIGWRFALASKLAAGFALVAVLANVLVWTHILAEFARNTVH